MAQRLRTPEGMKPTIAREKFVAQHEALRRLLGVAEDAASKMLEYGPVLDAFQHAVVNLATALLEHNAAEAELLEPMLRAGDDWAELRIERMIEEHVAEHAALRATLTGDDMDVARTMSRFSEDLRAHMDAEERTFLHPKALGDAAKGTK
jgi:hypothetical protein